ncbi:histidine phosphatase family protein [Caproiciproducens sp.]|uniref:histidine phosphatase family protein n=1 Tax=Caproiciproducens sp. TaxID=1954376 RepID=UPI002899DF20|nr:histidine phosphatase family protein [Caproiciproducens sp.]
MTRIILVRHCEAQGNTEGFFQGCIDSDISGNGKTQLELLSVRCRNMPFDAIYSSPLKRARITAEAINRYHHLPIQIEPRLHEIDGGEYEGRLWDELTRIYPEELQNWYFRPFDFAPKGGETMRMVYTRMWDAVTDIVKANQEKTICIVSHGCAIRNFLCHALHKSVEEINDVGWGDNTAISIIDFSADLQSNVVMMNDASHLTPELSVYAQQKWRMAENQVNPAVGEDR